MEDTTSISSKSSVTLSKEPTKKKNASSKEDKKKIKILKDALKDEMAKKESLEKELERTKSLNQNLEKELGEKDNKNLELYEENNQMQEKLIELQKKVASNPYTEGVNILYEIKLYQLEISKWHSGNKWNTT